MNWTLQEGDFSFTHVPEHVPLSTSTQVKKDIRPHNLVHILPFCILNDGMWETVCWQSNTRSLRKIICILFRISLLECATILYTPRYGRNKCPPNMVQFFWNEKNSCRHLLITCVALHCTSTMFLIHTLNPHCLLSDPRHCVMGEMNKKFFGSCYFTQQVTLQFLRCCNLSFFCQAFVSLHSSHTICSYTGQNFLFRRRLNTLEKKGNSICMKHNFCWSSSAECQAV